MQQARDASLISLLKRGIKEVNFGFKKPYLVKSLKRVRTECSGMEHLFLELP